MAKLTAQQIALILEKYEELGTYAATSRATGISANTVKRYVDINRATHTYDEIDCAIKPRPIETIKPEDLQTFTLLTAEEIASYNAWLKEFE